MFGENLFSIIHKLQVNRNYLGKKCREQVAQTRNQEKTIKKKGKKIPKQTENITQRRAKYYEFLVNSIEESRNRKPSPAT